MLDIGCSFGFFLDVARSRGWERAGVEIGEYAAKFCKDNLKLEIHISDPREAPLQKNYFNAVTMWNVVEHFNDPLQQLLHIDSLMKKGGLIVFTTGDVDCYLRKIQGSNWRCFIPPIHVTNFNKRTAKRLLKSAGFKIIHRTVAFPREAILKKIKLIDILEKIQFSDKMMVLAKKYIQLIKYIELKRK